MRILQLVIEDVLVPQGAVNVFCTVAAIAPAVRVRKRLRFYRLAQRHDLVIQRQATAAPSVDLDAHVIDFGVLQSAAQVLITEFGKLVHALIISVVFGLQLRLRCLGLFRAIQCQAQGALDVLS